MKMTRDQKREVEKIRNNPHIKLQNGMTDEEVLAQARFIEDGEGIDVYDSEEAFRAAMKKKNIDDIEEV